MSEIRPELHLWVAYLEKKEQLEEAQDRIAELERLLGRWLEADDEGDGHECIHAIAAARAALEGKKDE